MPNPSVIKNMRTHIIASNFEYFQIGGRSKNWRNIPRKLTMTIDARAAFGKTDKNLPNANNVTITTTEDSVVKNMPYRVSVYQICSAYPYTYPDTPSTLGSKLEIETWNRNIKKFNFKNYTPYPGYAGTYPDQKCGYPLTHPYIGDSPNFAYPWPGVSVFFKTLTEDVIDASWVVPPDESCNDVRDKDAVDGIPLNNAPNAAVFTMYGIRHLWQ